MSELVTIDHPLVKHKLTLMRNKDTSTAKFRSLMHELSLLLAYEVTRDLDMADVEVETPLVKAKLPMLHPKKPALISILRAGNGMIDGFIKLMPTAKIGHIGLYRDDAANTVVEYYLKFPNDLEERTAFVLDPMLATGKSASAAISRVKQANPKKIELVCVLAAPEGVEYVRSQHPDVKIYTASLDQGLNEKNYIVPGLGDAGDRLFGTL